MSIRFIATLALLAAAIAVTSIITVRLNPTELNHPFYDTPKSPPLGVGDHIGEFAGIYKNKYDPPQTIHINMTRRLFNPALH